MDVMRLMRRDFNRLRGLPREEQSRLAILWKEQGDLDARNRLVSANLGWVVKQAKRLCRPGTEISDLVTVGVLTMLHAAELFDPYLGTTFLTYTGRAVCQEMKRFQWSDRAISSPTYLSEIRPENVTEAQQARIDGAKTIISIDSQTAQKGNGGHDMMLRDTIPDHRRYQCSAETMEQFEIIVQAMADLTPRMKDVIRLRMKGLTQDDVAAELDITRSRVGQLEGRGLQLVREKIGADGIGMTMGSAGF